MSKIKTLVSRLCPHGVEFKALGEIAELVRGNGLPKSAFTDSGIGCVHYGQIYTYYGIWADKTISFVAPETAAPLTKVDTGDIIITNTSENVEDVCKAVAWLGESQIVTGGHATVIKHTQDPKYLSYYFCTPEFFDQKKRLAIGAKVIDVSAKHLAKVRVPVPPIEVQREIVRILDTFAELTAELTARKKQYKHYRDQLLRIEGREVEWKALGEIGEFIRGKRFTKADFVDQGIDAIHYGEIYTRYGVWTDHAVTKVRPDLQGSLRYASPNDVVLTGVGETVEDVGKAVAWIGSGNVAIHDDSYAFRHSMNPKYIAYAMQTASFIDEKAKHVSRGKVNRLLVDGVAKVRVPIPYPNDAKKSLAEQARIVAILDKFDALTHSIAEGLPRELELRQKQYEYYRDQLLSFPQPQEAAA